MHLGISLGTPFWTPFAPWIQGAKRPLGTIGIRTGIGWSPAVHGSYEHPGPSDLGYILGASIHPILRIYDPYWDPYPHLGVTLLSERYWVNGARSELASLWELIPWRVGVAGPGPFGIPWPLLDTYMRVYTPDIGCIASQRVPPNHPYDVNSSIGLAGSTVLLDTVYPPYMTKGSKGGLATWPSSRGVLVRGFS